MNWNLPGAALPSAQARRAELLDKCKALTRQPNSPEDRSAADEGWILVGPRMEFSGTVLIEGEADANGLCEPLSYQVMIFKNGKFAGTISPYSMNSRQDGASINLQFYQADHFKIAFERYAESDPLCCPSKQTWVSYSIEDVNGQPLLVPSNPYTTPIK